MTKSKSKQPKNQPKTTEQPESPANLTMAPSSKPVAKGFVVNDSPGQQIFIGGLPGKPPRATKASDWRVPKGSTLVEDGESHIFVGGFPCAPPKKQK